MASPAVGDLIGPYRLEAHLGQGGMGDVYRARRESDEAVVALKLLKSTLLHDPQQVRRFAREARAAREIEHPHLLAVIDVGSSSERQYLAMRYVRGPSLAERIHAAGRLPVQETVRIVAQVASALDALHRAGVVHRDVKPSNVLLDPVSGALLSDFGLAKRQDYSTVTRPGALIGTLDYLAPEVLRGADGSPSADLYALGCVACECLVGRPPFAGNKFAVGLGHLEEEPPDPAGVRADVPAELGTAVRRALAKDPAQRPPSATAWARMLIVSARSG
jgi:serine/threonine-protein kinase